MRLNPDCIRDILLVLEERTAYGIRFSLPDNEAISKYSDDEMKYHLRQCEMSGFFYKPDWDQSGKCTVGDITPRAHDFLANIRSDTVWNNTKGIIEKVGAKSLSAVVQIASNVVSEIIKSHLRANGAIF